MSFLRQSVASALLAVFVTVSVLGTGLHLIPGCGHFHAPGHGCDAHSHAGHHHHPEQDGCELCHSHGDCAICRFLAIPRALAPPPTVVVCGNCGEPIVAARRLAGALELERPYGARAPPRHSLNA